MKRRVNTSKTIAATAIPFQKGRSVCAVAASTTRRVVEVVSKVKVTILAPHIMGRDEEVCKPMGANVPTEDQRVGEEFQKAVLRDKEFDLVLAGATE